jgi:hypothetical protein
MFKKSLKLTGIALLGAAVMLFGITTGVSAASPAATTTAPADMNAACTSCHSLSQLQVTFPGGEKMSAIVDNQAFMSSVHGQIVKCSVCHVDIAKNATIYPHPVITENSSYDWKLAQNKVCGTCHSTEYSQFNSSIHGVQDGVQIALCTDCHTAHNVLNTSSNAYRSDSLNYCSKCHGDSALMNKYGISTNVVSSYLQDFHGKTTYLVGEEAKNLPIETAVCFDCHGSHQIMKMTSTAAIQTNFAAACEKCHPGATANFTGAWLSHKTPGTTYAQAVFGVSWFYRIMIAFVFLGLFIHIGFDIYKRRKSKKEAE